MPAMAPRISLLFLLLLPLLAQGGDSLRRHRPRKDACASENKKLAIVEQMLENEKKHISSLEADKQALTESVTQVLQTNQTIMLQREVQEMQNMKLALEQRCASDRGELEGKLKENTEKNAAVKIVAKTLQEQNAELQREVAKLRSEVSELRSNQAGLQADKVQLVHTLQGVLTQSAAERQAVASEELARQKQPQAPSMGPLAETAAASAAGKKKDSGMHMHHHEEADTIANMGHMSAVEKYVDESDRHNAVVAAAESVSSDDDEGDEQQEAPKPAPETTLSRWLLGGGQAAPTRLDAVSSRRGAVAPPSMSPVDSLAPPGVVQAAVAQQKQDQADSDDISDGVTNLLRQAEDAVNS